MTRLLCVLLMLFFSLSGPAMVVNGDFGRCSLAAKVTPKLKTVLGSGQDVAPYLAKPGYNVLQMDRSLPLDVRKSINTRWLDDAIDRGDELILKTDPIQWDRFMREIGKESFYNELELHQLFRRGVIDDLNLVY